MSPQNPIRLSVFHPQHLANGAKMVELNGWLCPSRYTNSKEEIETISKKVGILDNSPVGKIRVYAKDLDGFFSDILRQVTTLEKGQVTTHQFTEDSGISDVTEARLSEDETIIFTSPKQVKAVSNLLTNIDEECTHAVNVTSALAGFIIAGPNSDKLLAAVTEIDVSQRNFTDMTCVESKIAEIHGTLIRHDIGNIPSYEVYFGREYGTYMWDTFMDAGQPHGLKPVGIETITEIHHTNLKKSRL